VEPGYRVPEYSDDKLSTSSLIVADQMEAVPTKDVSTGSFVIGVTKVRPRVAPADGKPALFQAQSRPEGKLLDAGL